MGAGKDDIDRIAAELDKEHRAGQWYGQWHGWSGRKPKIRFGLKSYYPLTWTKWQDRIMRVLNEFPKASPELVYRVLQYRRGNSLTVDNIIQFMSSMSQFRYNQGVRA